MAALQGYSECSFVEEALVIPDTFQDEGKHTSSCLANKRRLTPLTSASSSYASDGNLDLHIARPT
jgi:hypothetical protein